MTAPTSTEEIEGRLEPVVASDPRIHERYVRRIDGPDAPVALVGVLHDHIASIHRTETVIDAVSPASVGVELPDLLVSAFLPVIPSSDDWKFRARGVLGRCR